MRCKSNRKMSHKLTPLSSVSCKQQVVMWVGLNSISLTEEKEMKLRAITKVGNFKCRRFLSDNLQPTSPMWRHLWRFFWFSLCLFQGGAFTTIPCRLHWFALTSTSLWYGPNPRIREIINVLLQSGRIKQSDADWLSTGGRNVLNCCWHDSWCYPAVFDLVRNSGPSH